MFDFGFLFRSWEVVTNAAREGARVGVLPAYACDDSDHRRRGPRRRLHGGVGHQRRRLYDVTSSTVPVATAGGNFSACVVSVEMTQQLPSLGVIGTFFGGTFGDVPLRATAVDAHRSAGRAPKHLSTGVLT